MTTKPSKNAIEAFFKNAKAVKCSKCGQEYQTVEKDLTCYICGTNVKLGVVFN